MTNQIIPIRQNHDDIIDDAMIRMVNENHDRLVRERRQAYERQIRQQQERLAAREQILNNLYYALFGAAFALAAITFVLMVTV